MTKQTRQAYSKRASEYLAVLGSVRDMDPLDIACITSWGTDIVGPILDAGSGPGHWTELLRSNGCEVSGIDMVPELVDSARERFPLSSFTVGDLLALPFENAHFGGVLAWYSLIHMQPDMCAHAFDEIARILRPDGTLLVGVILGPQGVSFDHAIAEAFYWSEQGLVDQLESSGYQVLSTGTRFPERSRPHLEVLVRRL